MSEGKTANKGKMYATYSTTTTFWILCLTFVSIHHSHHQLKYANGAAIVTLPQPRPRADAIPQFRPLPEATTKEVIGDVEQPDIATQSEGILQRRPPKEGASVWSAAKTIKENSIKSILALQLKEKTQKLNDTRGGGGGGDDTHRQGAITTDNTPDSTMKLTALKKQSENNQVYVKHFKQKIDGDYLSKDFKENLQQLLKSSDDNDNGNHKTQGTIAGGSSPSGSSSSINKSQNDNGYLMATSTSSTMKRAASSPATPQARTTSMTHPFSSYGHGYGYGSATNTSFSNKGYGSAKQQLPLQEGRRHIVPEKLQYTEEITIKQGRLMGIRRNFHSSAGIRDVDQYLGIPYAEAPVGSRRFMPPGAALPWPGLKMAHHLPPVCPQKLPDISLQGTAKMSKSRYRHLTRLLPYLKTESEDCLYLNVYVPNANHGGGGSSSSSSTTTTTTGSTSFESEDEDEFDRHPLYPVVVYIHGESFEWNSGNAYDGSVLASYSEVIVVTVNYRIGILGFMRPSINENTVANFGLLDQIAALHWIKENIHSFGGDKDSVTLMGHSTGAACINYLMISPVASGLFHRAILMSGSAMSDWSATNHSMQLTMQIAHGLNCPLNDDNEEMLSCLRQKRYDLLFGITESESYHSLGAEALDEGLRENERDNLLRFYMQSRFDVRPDLALAATLKKYSDMYTNPIKATNMEHRDVVLDILSDARVVGPLIQTGLFHAEVNRRNYMYVFGHNSFGGPHAVLPHSIAGEELAFVFGAPLSSAGLFHGIHYTAQEKLLAEAVMSYWCNFAKTGNPKAPWKESFINLHAMEWDRYDLEWPEFNKRSQAYMNIGIPPSIGYKYRQVYMHFWNKELPDELNQIAHIQQQPFLEANYANTMPSLPGTTAIYPKPYGGSEVITGHMNKFGARDDGAEDPVRTLKVLMQQPTGRQKAGETAENMYNAPPSTTYVGKVRHRPSTSGEDGEGDEARSYEMGYNNFGFAARAPTTSASIYGIRHYDAGANGMAGNGLEQTPYGHPYPNGNSGNYASEDNKADDGMADADSQQEHVAKSETTLQLLIGLIIIFIILNVIIYSTILMQKKKKTQTIQRKLGTGILTAYDGSNDDDLKRSKPSTHQDDGDSYIMDAMRKSNTYEAVKTERISSNGFKMTRQLSCSTVDTHTKVSEWMCTTGQNKVALPRRPSSNKDSKKSSSSFSSLGGSGGSFGKHPLKVSVAIDATSETRGSSVMEQEPIEVTKSKNDGRNRIICQEVEVDDQELLTPQDSLDNSRYTLMRQHSTVTEACEGELIQPMHYHSRSDPVDIYYSLRYDLLFGITESESYHSLGAEALDEGLRENERDNLLRFYMQSRFDVRPDLALAATLKKYSDMYTNPIKATNMEHRDVVLDILSDARVVGPLIQTGLFHAEVNRRNYMYVFGHNSFGGPHAVLPHSIAGEELAFVFGAPLSSAGLFHGIHYTAQEKLLAEAVMSYWCNFAKTGNPKAPWKESFINLHAMEWDRYDLEWPEFNKRSQAYMNIGIPPSIGYKYRQVYMHFWNKELPDELNQIAHIQQQPFLEANYANTMPSLPGTTAIYPKPYGGSEVITGHMNKFGARDDGAEDPVRTLKVLMQQPTGRQKAGETAENMYNAPPSTTYVGKVRHRPSTSGEDGEGDEARSYEMGYNNFGFAARAPTTSASIYGIRHYDAGANGMAGNGLEQTPYGHPYPNGNSGNYASEDNKADDGMADADSQQEHVAKSETTLQLLIGLIIIFIILNVIIYSTILMQKKKKTQTIQRKLGTGILTAYDGSNDDDLKRSKPSTHQDDGDSYIMDAMRKSNTYEAVKTERISSNGFKMTRQLSCSTVDTHTKVSEWMCTTGQNKVALPRRPSSNKDSKKSSSSFSSLGGSGGSFGKHPLKVSVAIDATSETRGSSVMEQEPIEVTKSKNDGRNRIICQEVEVDDQELLTPQDSLDNSRYTLMRQHSTVTEACEGELIQPMHYHSRSDPVDIYYS
uniref:Carboxylesterase type B domain-containing protein n=1 Tax=Stomoxys calcitrans TaxID=35570 RepID=A0A1I8PHR9_STOCA